MILFLINYFYKFCGEDEYQKNRFIKEPPYIYCEIFLKKSIDNIYEKINTSLQNYFMNRWPTINNIFSYKEVNNLIPDKKNILEIYKKENKLFCYFDHRYFSGYYFILFAENLFNIKAKDLKDELYIPFLSEYYILKFIYYYLSLPKIQKLPLVENKDSIRRENFNFDINEIKYLYNNSITKISKKYYVVYHILTYIYNKLNFTRAMRVLIPVAFKTTYTRYNNVGCVIIDFEKQSITKFINQIEKLEYQAHATHLLQQFLNYGKQTRSSVDIVLSLGYFYFDNDIVDNFYITYENIADYPIYCISITFNNKVYSTITYMNK
jgi:hypothetical protein